jgi:hypothetical protein
MKDTIEELKNNEFTIFAGLDVSLREKAMAIGKPNFEYRVSNGWNSASTCHFYEHTTYRLKAEYEEQEWVEYPVKPDAKGTLAYYHPTEGYACGVVTTAIDKADFIGFKYEDDPAAYPDPRMYKDEEGDMSTFWLPGYEVLTPTHVLFKC